MKALVTWNAKKQQPENDQNCGDKPKHVFISLFLSAITAADDVFPSKKITADVRGGLSRYAHFRMKAYFRAIPSRFQVTVL